MGYEPLDPTGSVLHITRKDRVEMTLPLVGTPPGGGAAAQLRKDTEQALRRRHRKYGGADGI